jgi:2-oxoglutarate dehydrogenase E2 component (dihydrolipoamide succinyltransferase)
MTVEIKVPGLPESVADATVGTWHKQPGDHVARGENILDLETDKVVLEVPAPKDGVLKAILKQEGDLVVADDVLAQFEVGAASSAPKAAAASDTARGDDLSPAVRRLIAEKGIDASLIKGTGKGGRITKADVENFVPAKTAAASKAAPVAPLSKPGAREEKRVPMNRMRKKIAERLLSSTQNTAMLTTFNEVDMKAVMDLRKVYKEAFQKKHNVKLGFMSFFISAALEALKRFPDVNASIDGDNLVYHGYFDIGVAVSTDRGLVVPVIRDTETLSMAGIEQQIIDYALRARDGKLSIEEMTGGTFTITNGGTFGSMLSTPILNQPQSAILGMHNIIERPVVVDGEIVIRPMMYLALSYDHRIIDGKTSVLFLKTIKELIEQPAQLTVERYMLGL